MNHFYLVQIRDNDGANIAQRYARTRESALKLARRYLYMNYFFEEKAKGTFEGDYQFKRGNCAYDITYCVPINKRAQNAPTFVSFIERVEITE
jgi:hypothetical protein